MDRLKEFVHRLGINNIARMTRAPERSFAAFILRLGMESEGVNVTFVDPAERVPEEPEPVQPLKHQEPRVSRNDPCPCGSGKKLKKCCGLRR